MFLNDHLTFPFFKHTLTKTCKKDPMVRSTFLFSHSSEKSYYPWRITHRQKAHKDWAQSTERSSSYFFHLSCVMSTDIFQIFHVTFLSIFLLVLSFERNQEKSVKRWYIIHKIRPAWINSQKNIFSSYICF